MDAPETRIPTPGRTNLLLPAESDPDHESGQNTWKDGPVMLKLGSRAIVRMDKEGWGAESQRAGGRVDEQADG